LPSPFRLWNQPGYCAGGADIVVGLNAGGRPAGFAAIDPTSGYLDQLCVAPAERGSGLASALLDEAKRRAPGAIELDVNEGKWEQIVTERADEISSPASGPELVFDYADHAEAPIVPSDDDPDDPDLSRYDITA